MPIRVLIFSGIVLYALTWSSCGPGGESSIITFKVKKAYHAETIDVLGEIEAKKSYSVITPQLNFQSLKIAHMVPEGKRVEKGDLVVKLESEAIENIYLRADNELQIAKAEGEKRKTELDLERLLLESRVKSLEASVAVSRLRLENISFEPERKQEIEKLQIEINEIDLRKLKSKLASLETIQKEERLRFQLKIKQEQNKLDQAKQHLQQMEIFAPVDGIFVYANNWYGEKVKVGDQMYPNQAIANIPDLRIMQLKLKLGETAAQKCREGQRTEVSSLFLEDIILNGKVSKVNRVAKPIHRRSKVKKVEVLVQLDSSDISITPGVSARGKIFISEGIETFAIPHECIFTRDSLKIIYLYKRGDFEPYVVNTDRQSTEFVYINVGLKNGDEIAFQEPNDNEIDWSEHILTPADKNMNTDSTDVESEQEYR